MHESRGGPASGSDDVEAFEAFYRREYPAAVRLARLLLRDHAQAEEIAQEAFVRMLPRVGSTENPGGYVHTAVVNLCRDQHRRSARLRSLPRSRERFAPPPDLPASSSAVWLALWDLPQNQREVLVLRFYLDQTTDRIAETLGFPVGTVRSLIHRGLATLKQVIPHD